MGTYNRIEEAIDIINDRDKPLALYIFSNNKKTVKFVQENTSSGGFTSNDTMTHAACNTLPFGGVGPSGIGGYHGKHSFDAFSHMKPCMHKYPGLESLNDVRVAPYTPKKLSTLCWFLGYPTSLNHNASPLRKALKLMGVGFILAAIVWAVKQYYSH